MSWKELFRSRIPIQILSGGHVLTDKQIPVPITSASIIKGDNPGEVITEVPFADKKRWHLINIEWEESSTRSAGKAAAGAIAGTVVAGPIGTIAGAAMGGKKKDTSKAFVYLVGEDNVEHALHIRCDQKQYTQIASYIG
ncbi:hypothetical protein SAMN04487777_13216 [Priestia aryabhattai B8W22]|uniref:hypothetical protein n=1 Tax=Priestia aryabhattai TaxID=412384 RepID=UPI000884A1F0|nr:hypothetical protein SAMN04487777_13216 [Priestia aryabhattai B8W22]